MKRPSRITRILKRIFKLKKWLDWERVKASTLYLGQGFKRIFVSQKHEESESFDEATNKLHLSEENLREKQKSLFSLSVLMVVSAVIIFLYSAYQLFYGSYRAFFVSLVLTLIALALAFRYHFWYFQIKKRKLGCTFQEWYREGVLRDKK